MKKIKDMTKEEYKRFLEDRDRELTASIGDFIRYLEDHFRPEDNLCYVDCVEGVKYEVRPLLKDELGKTKFRRVGDLKKDDDGAYCYVDKEDILIT